MTRRLLLTVVRAAALLLLPLPAAAQTFTFERSFPATAAMTTVDITTDNGSVKVSAGDTDAVVVIGTIKLRRGGFVLPIDAPDRAKELAAKPPIAGDTTTIFLRQP